MFSPSPSSLQHPTLHDTHTPQLKQKFYRSIRWIIIPLALMLITAFTRFRTHPAIFDLLSRDGDHKWTGWTHLSPWSFHEPHHLVTPNHLRTRASTTPAPTVPVNPALPTPFPQPFDTTLSTNFSTNACYDFFLNMTEGDAFRSCRPFSLLLPSSYEFSQAQMDIDLMNTDIWGICNTDTPQSQCDVNMSWFASSLTSSCQIDLADQVATVLETINALHAYDLMRNAACQMDVTRNSYCFVEAVANSDPSSYWFYQLPLGQPLGPNITSKACSQCTSSLMALYASALNSDNSTNLTGLEQTYNSAAVTLNSVCGSSYAETADVSTSSAARGVSRASSVVALGFLVLFTGMLCCN